MAKTPACSLTSLRYRHSMLQDETQYMRTYAVMPKDYNSSTVPTAVGVVITTGFNKKAATLRPAPTIMIPMGPGVA